MTPEKVTIRFLDSGIGYDFNDDAAMVDAQEVWLPRVGPTSWLLLVKLHEIGDLRQSDGDVTIPVEKIAAWLGVQGHTVWRAFQRLAGWRHGALEGDTFTMPAKIRFATEREQKRGTRWTHATN